MKINLSMLVAQIVGMFVVFALTLFLAAGTVVWIPGWVFLFVFFSFVTAISYWLAKHNPGLLVERMTGIGKPDQKVWDKFFFVLANVIFLLWLIVMPLDAARFHWSRVPLWLQIVGAILLFCSFYLFYLTYRENSFLSPAIRIQNDRGQTVVSTGPYRYVRHPMYSASIPFIFGTTLMLGSWFGILPGALLLVGIARRAVMEERTLGKELQEYDKYLSEVRYRLIPYIW
jgi:protein-S-isoprenylcysteine O-methyltransferase Ste14